MKHRLPLNLSPARDARIGWKALVRVRAHPRDQGLGALMRPRASRDLQELAQSRALVDAWFVDQMFGHISLPLLNIEGTAYHILPFRPKPARPLLTPL